MCSCFGWYKSQTPLSGDRLTWPSRATLLKMSTGDLKARIRLIKILPEKKWNIPLLKLFSQELKKRDLAIMMKCMGTICE